MSGSPGMSGSTGLGAPGPIGPGLGGSGRGLPRLGGSVVALVTPFADGRIDEARLAALCERQVAGGSAALLVCGSTGEAPSLTPESHARVIRVAVAAAGSAMPVIAGCGAPATRAAAELARSAARCGAAALLCAPPPYVRPTQAGIVAHVQEVAAAGGLPVLLYDVPGRTGVAVQDATVQALFAAGTIVGLKDATADLSRPARLRALCGPGLLQMTGDDATAGAHRAAGGHGCISVTANLVPALCALLHRAWEAGDLAGFARTRDLLAPLGEALFLESNPIPLKAALAMLGLDSGELRLPLLRAGPATLDRLADVLPSIMQAEEALAAKPRYALAS